MTPLLPPRIENDSGEPRRVGIELEMNGLTLDQLARCVADELDLDIEDRGRYERVLTGDPAGDWGVELDFDLLKRLGREERDKGTLSGDLGDSAEDMLKWLAETVVPLELVSPPLPMNRLAQAEDLIDRIRSAGAKGTSDRWINAFGMQFNPEVPSEEADSITAHLKAFVCLYDWLLARANIDFSRQVTPYIDAYPNRYNALLVADDYWPTQDQLIDDYLKDNPTRNRALDMLPLFAHLDRERVREKVDDTLVKARPTFHYRLPNCEIHRSDWGLSLAWNDWVQVERLAADPSRLKACCHAYQKFLSNPLERWFGDWQKQVEAKWIDR